MKILFYIILGVIMLETQTTIDTLNLELETQMETWEEAQIELEELI